jgi:3-hydroxyisobutyrate dehydrogenase-like beta-hydroxyacid dehydrogenase
MTETIGFIGLGHMGLPMARNLLDAGHAVRAWNRTAARTDALAAAGAVPAASPADAAPEKGIVVTMVADDRALEEVVFGPGGLAERSANGLVHLSMSTIAPETARRLAAEQARHGGLYASAPVFGRPEAAAARKLWICLSGSEAARARVRPILEVLGQGTFEFGEDSGAANVVKLSGNFLIAAAMEAMAEIAALAEKSGLERSAVIGMLARTLFSCPIYQNYGAAIAERRHEPAGFRLALGLKDVDLALQAARSAGSPMPMASLLHDRLLSAVARGRGALDWSALALGAGEDAGLPARR